MRYQEIPWGSLGVLWESLGVLGGRSGIPLGSLGITGGSSAGPRVTLGRSQKGPKTQKVFLECRGDALGGPWGDFGRLGGP